MLEKDSQLDIISEYYMGIRDNAPNEKFSSHYSKVYTSPIVIAGLSLNASEKTPYRQSLLIRAE